MDGGSTDNFREVVEGYSDIITLVRSAPDEGQAERSKIARVLILGSY
jgi:hypothetical protein